MVSSYSVCGCVLLQCVFFPLSHFPYSVCVVGVGTKGGVLFIGPPTDSSLYQSLISCFFPPVRWLYGEWSPLRH